MTERRARSMIEAFGRLSLAAGLLLGGPSGCAKGGTQGMDAAAATPDGGGGTLDAALPGDGGPTDGAPPGDTGAPTEDAATDRCAFVECPSDECRDSACDPATGACVTTDLPDGTSCGVAAGSCFDGGTCTAGVCSGTPRPDGAACDDGSGCTTGESCSSGACAGGAPLDCSSLDGPCAVGRCDPGTEACVAAPAADGTSCDDGDACTVSDTCAAGVCGGTGPDCSAMDDACHVGVCDPVGGGCTQQARADGSSCDDADRCTVGDACAAGTCAGTPMDCSGAGDLCHPASCDPGSGACATTPVDCSGSSTDCAAATCDLGTGGCVVLAPSPLCSACPSGFCAVDGSCQSSVTSASYDFEAGLPPGWTQTGAAPWSTTGTSPHGGAFAAQSGAIGNSQSSGLSATFDFAVATSVRFWLRTSTESGFDYLRLFVDGVERATWSGSTAWTEHTFAMGAGSHSVEWRYTKDGSFTGGSDAVWIDDVTITPGIGLRTVATIDFEGSASLPGALRTSGAAGWIVDSSNAHAGARAGANGDITHDEISSLFYDVSLTGPGQLRFWYATSTESSYDYLRLYLDGVLQAEWSGTNAWAQRTLPIGAGAHTIEWRYDKDGSFNGGSDTVWVDDIVLEEQVPPAPALCGP